MAVRKRFLHQYMKEEGRTPWAAGDSSSDEHVRADDDEDEEDDEVVRTKRVDEDEDDDDDNGVEEDEEDEALEEQRGRGGGRRGRPPSSGRLPQPQSQAQSPPSSADKPKSNRGRKPKDPTLYCYCKRPYDAREFMIGCDSCGNWYHGRCVNITPQEAQDIDVYTCPECRPKSHNEADLTAASLLGQGLSSSQPLLGGGSPLFSPSASSLGSTSVLVGSPPGRPGRRKGHAVRAIKAHEPISPISPLGPLAGQGQRISPTAGPGNPMPQPSQSAVQRDISPNSRLLDGSMRSFVKNELNGQELDERSDNSAVSALANGSQSRGLMRHMSASGLASIASAAAALSAEGPYGATPPVKRRPGRPAKRKPLEGSASASDMLGPSSPLAPAQPAREASPPSPVYLPGPSPLLERRDRPARGGYTLRGQVSASLASSPSMAAQPLTRDSAVSQSQSAPPTAASTPGVPRPRGRPKRQRTEEQLASGSVLNDGVSNDSAAASASTDMKVDVPSSDPAAASPAPASAATSAANTPATGARTTTKEPFSAPSSGSTPSASAVGIPSEAPVPKVPARRGRKPRAKATEEEKDTPKDDEKKAAAKKAEEPESKPVEKPKSEKDEGRKKPGRKPKTIPLPPAFALPPDLDIAPRRAKLAAYFPEDYRGRPPPKKPPPPESSSESESEASAASGSGQDSSGSDGEGENKDESSSSGEASDTRPVYCICKKPYDNRSFMLCCTKCKDWFHGSCIGIAWQEAKKIKHFVCPTCSGK